MLPHFFPDAAHRRTERFGVEQIHQTVARRFERQVELYPDRTAIRTRSESLSYAELNRRANRIARTILARSEPGSEPVAVLMDKSAQVYAALLGVIKAGKFYVPLAPQYPRARNALIVEDAGVRLVVADTRNVVEGHALAGASGQVINCDDIDITAPATNPQVSAVSTDPVYILYTSGTNGRPKGVVESHRNLLHNIRNYANGYNLSPGDRMVCLGSHVYSGSTKDIYGSLLNGAALYPVDVQTEGLTGLAQWMASERITIYDSVPTVFRHFIGTLTGAEDLSAIRVVRLGGELVAAPDVELFRQHFARHCVLVNGYGSTETGTACTFDATHDTPLPSGPLPIGWSTDGMTVLVVDDSGRELPHGEIGQLAVRSDYLALGYWNRPDLTERAFRTDLPGITGRVYLTGDMGYRTADGCLIGVGRQDSQVKIRGHRIELAEVEAALLTHSAVREAVVVPRTDGAADLSLIGYVAPVDRDHLPGPADLRRFLEDRLPTHSIPAAIVVVDSFPVTVNGKLDLKALPTPPCPTPLGDTVGVRTETEERLAAIWRSVLRLSDVGVTNDFFALGGNSLTAARMMVQVQREFGVELPLSVLLEAGTISQLAKRIGNDDESDAPCLVPIQSGGSRPPLFLVHSLGGEVLSYGPLARCLGSDQPVYGFRARLPRDGEQPTVSVEEMAATYVAELLRFQPAGPYRLGGYSGGGTLAYEMARQLTQSGREVAGVLIIDQRCPERRSWEGWTLLGVARAARNLPRWIQADLLSAGLPTLWSRACTKLRALRRRLAGSTALDVSSFVDVRRLPARYQALWQANFRAFRSYVPTLYSGRVWLFRSQAQPLLPGDWHRADMGWGKFAPGGLTVAVVPGNHDTVLAEPNVRRLAQQLSRVLAEL